MDQPNKIIAPMRIGITATLVLGALSAGLAEACTRALYVGDNGLVITGRSMDWGEDMH